MSDYIDTREPGWRRTTPGEEKWPNAIERIEYFRDGREIGWVREEPVPPLPSQPWTLIWVVWRDRVMDAAPRALYLNPALDWYDGNQSYTPGVLSRSITSFEVLAWPADRHDAEFERQRDLMLKRTTAKAVLDRIASEPWARETDLQKWRDEFEVTW